MPYVKTWDVAKYINLDAAQWRNIVTDIDSHLLQFGWVRDGDNTDIGVIDDIVDFPEKDIYPITRFYKINDPHTVTAGEIYMRVQFGANRTLIGSYSSSSIPSRWFGYKIDFSENPSFNNTIYVRGLANGVDTVGWSTSETGYLSYPSKSLVSWDPQTGFFGLIYGSGAIAVNSYAEPPASAVGNVGGPLFAFMVQRNRDSQGQIVKGFQVVAPYQQRTDLSYSGGSNNITFRNTVRPTAKFLKDNTIYQMGVEGWVNIPVDPLKPIPSTDQGLPQIFPSWICTPTIKESPNIVVYPIDQIIEGSVFSVDTVYGKRNFIALGNGARMYTQGYGGIAMVWE